MTSFTIKVDEKTARSFEAAAIERELSVEELIIGMASWTLAKQDLKNRDPYTPEQISQIEEAIAEVERGETVSHDKILANLRERFPQATGRQIIERALKSYGELLAYEADMPAFHEDWDAEVARGLEAMERRDETPQDEVFARWRARYG